ncbi:endo-1,4-beta-xylanase [Mucilaginibacter gracilis]|uniref:Beta-xylanase n=1 Tax=Mucilaginibacter gracilis TaxID=423350 RepID=A0A495J007_9SPHI|nr:endo-1,4-beta-xylanase [Mucilaginibacter gracilis]RKR81971.1 endo-1,4-beta-xylanase [Mucilaginibacter gracilis]
MKSTFTKVLLLSVLYLGCSKSDSKDGGTKTTTPTDGTTNTVVYTTLKQANTDIVIGASINLGFLTNSAFLSLVPTQYNSITAENNMKVRFLQPSEGRFSFDTVKALLTFAKANNIRIHGHNLVWHKSNPAWIAAYETGTAQPALFDTLLKRHITEVVKYYSTQFEADGMTPIVKSWDVVNEAIYDSGNIRNAKNIDASNGDDQGSIWRRNIGKDDIKKAFTYARMAAEQNHNPNLKLFYNDYNIEKLAVKRDSIYKLLMDLKTYSYNGKPIIDGIGIQMHLDYNADESLIKAAIVKMASTGLLVHISEMDVKLADQPATVYIPNPVQLGLQDSLYKHVPMLYRKYVPAAQRFGITTWSVGDKDSGTTFNYSPQTQKNSATLYDLNYAKKAAWNYFFDGLFLNPLSTL